MAGSWPASSTPTAGTWSSTRGIRRSARWAGCCWPSRSTVAVGVTSNLSRDVHGVLRLELPSGWRSEPAEFAVDLKKRGEKQDYQFKVFTTGLQQGRTTVRAVLESDGDKYGEG